MEKIADLIDQVISDPEGEPNLKKVRKQVEEMMEKHPLYIS